MQEKETIDEKVAQKPVKILIIRFSSIGDIVLTTPIIRCVKQQVQNAEVHYVTKYAYRHILEHNPYIDKLHLLQDDLPNLIKELQQQNFDFIIDLHHNLRTLKVKRALKAKSYSFNKLNLHKWLLTALKINLLPKVHIVDRYLDTVKPLGVKNDGQGLDYFLGKHDHVPDDHIPHSHYFGYIAVVIGAAHNTKKLPIHKLQEFCKSIDYPIILLGGPEDRKDGDAIAAVDDVKVYNSCGKFTLNESADLVRRAKLVVTHDTGLMHIAAAFKKPIISVWGNTVPSFGMTPFYGFASQTEDRMEVKNLWCRPCSKIGYSRCPLGHFKCMEKHDIQEMVMRAIAKVK
ncbi:glycosyltransferase family 9 protein [Aridibaculum aurantiacum]|uniref:glycosyltransferase family 9 protein n=1 Tax=Aridibaculum aurantiacum TaxID=2810307 RepID=UPI001F6152F8|nr:glycosyltransferase family 9 protein [Aridibaculum aurantiacum]